MSSMTSPPQESERARVTACAAFSPSLRARDRLWLRESDQACPLSALLVAGDIPASNLSVRLRPTSRQQLTSYDNRLARNHRVARRRPTAGARRVAKHATITKEMVRNVLRRRRIDCFRHGHPGYSDWLAEHPHGFVLTLRGPDVPPILHRADCPHVSSRRHQHPKADQCEKRCSPQRATLEQSAQGKHGLPRLRLCVQCVRAARL